jgi:hypothetical protein
MMLGIWLDDGYHRAETQRGTGEQVDGLEVEEPVPKR